MLKSARKWTTKFLISHTTVTLNEGQGHPNAYRNVELSDFYHHTRFEINRSVNVWIQANVKVCVGFLLLLLFPVRHGSEETQGVNERSFPIRRGFEETHGINERSFPVRPGFEETHYVNERSFPYVVGSKRPTMLTNEAFPYVMGP